MVLKPNEFMLGLLEMEDQATGFDISKWNGEWQPTEEQLQRVRIIGDVIILRAGYGAADGQSYEDVLFKSFYQKFVTQVPKAVKGVYWYFSSKSDWQKQYAKFKEIIEGMDFDIYVLDFETFYNEKSQYFAMGAVYFMEQLERDFPGKRIMLYCGKYTYDGWITLYTKRLDRFPLWHAQYPWATWLDDLTSYFKDWWIKLFNGQQSPRLPVVRGSDDWELWQIGATTGLGNELGFPTTDSLDVNLSRRGLKDFYLWATGREYDEPEPTDPTDPEEPELPIEHPDLGSLEEVLQDAYKFRDDLTEAFVGVAEALNQVLEDLDDALTQLGEK